MLIRHGHACVLEIKARWIIFLGGGGGRGGGGHSEQYSILKGSNPKGGGQGG